MKEVATSITKNITVMGGAQIVTWASSFVLLIFLPRYLGDAAYGRLFFAISSTALAGMIIELGLGTLFAKEIARDRTKAPTYLLNGAILKTLLWLLFFPCLMLFVVRSGYPRETVDVVIILGVKIILGELTTLVNRIFQSHERLEYRSYAVIVERVFVSAAGVTMLLLGYGVKTIAVVMLMGTLLNLITGLSLLPRLMTFSFKVIPSLWPVLLKQGLPFLLLSCFSFIYFRIDVIMLSEMTNENVVGWYGAPYRLFDALMFFPFIIQFVSLPVFSRLWTGARDAMAETARRILDVTLIVGIAIAILLFTLAKPLVALLFGLESYANSVILLQILAIILPLVYVNFLMATVVNAADKQKQVAIVAGIATVINVLLNYWLITYFQQTSGNGAIGAAVATAVTEVYMMVMFFYLLPSQCFSSANLAVAVKTLAAGVMMAFVIWWVESQILLYYISGMAGIVFYIAALIATRVLTKQDMYFIRTLIRTRGAGVSEPTSA